MRAREGSEFTSVLGSLCCGPSCRRSYHLAPTFGSPFAEISHIIHSCPVLLALRALHGRRPANHVSCVTQLITCKPQSLKALVVLLPERSSRSATPDSNGHRTVAVCISHAPWPADGRRARWTTSGKSELNRFPKPICTKSSRKTRRSAIMFLLHLLFSSELWLS